MPSRAVAKIGRAAFLALVISFTVVWFLPILFIFFQMFKDNSEILMTPWALPTRLRFDVMMSAWKTGQFSVFYLNSAYVTAASIAITVTVSALAAYAFARMRFFGSRALFGYMIAGMMVSTYTIIIPLYLYVKKLGLMDTREALVLVYSATSIPFSVYFLAMFFRTVPLEPRAERRSDVERAPLVVVDDVDDAVVGVHPPGGCVGRVALGSDALVPVVVRGRAVLRLDRLEPGVLARRLVEVAVDDDRAGGGDHVAVLELLQPEQELAAAASGHDDDPRGVHVVPPSVDGRVHADLAVGRDDVVAIHDRPPQAGALADRGVVHDDRVLDHRALVDPHRAPEDGVADGGALDQRGLADVYVVHVAPDEARRRADKGSMGKAGEQPIDTLIHGQEGNPQIGQVILSMVVAVW